MRLLLGKFGIVEHEKFTNFILPRHPREISFQETIQIITKIFGEQCSLVNAQWQYLNLAKKENEDYMTFASIVNRECENVYYTLPYLGDIRGIYDKFPDFFLMGTFIDSTHMKL